MRVLILNADYPDFLSWLYATRDRLAEASYDVQWKARMATFFMFADSYSHNLKALGHEAWEVHANNVHLQTTWGREHGLRLCAENARGALRNRGLRMIKRLAFRYGPPAAARALARVRVPHPGPKGWMYDILTAQIEWYKPDVILNQYVYFDPHYLRAVAPLTRLMVGQHAAALPPPLHFSPYDVVLSSLPNLVDGLRTGGHRAELHRLGFDPRVLRHLSGTFPRIEASFVGRVTPDHESRGAWLRAVAARVPLEVWGGAAPEPGPFHACWHPPVWGLDMFDVLHRSAVTLNRHIDVAAGYANNLRLFEATGVGAMLITDAKENLADLFEPGQEVVTYTSPEDCVEKVFYYLAHEEERRRISESGQQRTLRCHTYRQRMGELVDLLSRELAAKR